MDGRRARLVRRSPFGEPLSGDERTSRKASLFFGDNCLGIEGSDVAEKYLIRAAQRERFFTGSSEHQNVGSRLFRALCISSM